MRKLVSAALVAAAAFLSAPFVNAADHREAPSISEDPAADINDVYVFTSPADASKIVFVMTVNPFISPTNQLASHFSPDVRYRFAIDTSGDAIADEYVDVTFGALLPGPQQFTVKLPGGISVTGNVTAPTEAATPNPAVITESSQGIKIFAGPRDDPFFFDFVGFNRFLAGGQFTHQDSFAGFNVTAIVVELPLALITTSTHPHLQIWGITQRQTVTVRRGPGTSTQVSTGPFRQIERMGNPAISTVLISKPNKDLFNLGEPKDDAANFAGDIVNHLKAFGTNDTNIGILASVAVPDTLKFDPTQPSHFPNGRALADDVVDTLLYFIFNQPADPSTASDGVQANDVPFLAEFPYVAPPHQPQP
jgi:hypothetical protein